VWLDRDEARNRQRKHSATVSHNKTSDMRQHTILIILLLATLSSNAQNDKLTKSLNSYSIDLYGQLKTDNENLFISPLSSYYALLIAYEGAKNETRQEFEKVLHIDNYEYLSDFNAFSENLITWRDSSNYLNISNAIWLQKDFSIKADYKNKITQKYSSDLKTVDFKQNVNASNEINDWVTIKTNGLIKNIISPSDINNYTRLIISNAIYFIGKWGDEFDKTLTKPDDFYSVDKSKSEIDFMNKTEYLSYYDNNDFQFISKTYEGNDKSFCIILPKTRYGLINIEKELTNSVIDTILDNTKYLQVRLSIPKFKLETAYSLIEPLNKLGLEKAFKPGADFSGITIEEPLLINKIYHKAFIEIDEEKTEAAAATIVAMMTGSAGGSMPKPKIFKADHPFTFLIIDNKTKGIIFIGRYVRPE
jgi:serpin B